MQPKHPEIHPAFAGADVADVLKQVVEVVRHARPGRILQPLIVEHEAFDKVFLEPHGGPLPELNSPLGAHAVTDGEDHLQAVVVNLPFYCPPALVLNYSILSNSCLWPKFTIGDDLLDVVVDGGDAHLI